MALRRCAPAEAANRPDEVLVAAVRVELRLVDKRREVEWREVDAREVLAALACAPLE